MHIVQKIKEKKELKGLPDDLVQSVLNSVIKNKKYLDSDKNQKIIVKEVREQLRRYTGQYATKHNLKNREKLLKERDFNEILKQHISTRERLDDYNLVKEIINKIAPSSILDIGCGLNPIAIASKGVRYHAYDINHNDLDIVKEFFIINKIDGDIHYKDITKEAVFPKAGLCIIFKVLDILGKERNNVTKKLLTEIDSKFFLISFATATLSGKPMNYPYRKWFEKIMQSLKYKYEVKRTSRELFYVVEKYSK